MPKDKDNDKDKKRKYLLFSKDDARPSSQKPCAFFISPEGCRNGSKCPFLHEKSNTSSSSSSSSSSSVPKTISNQDKDSANKSISKKSSLIMTNNKNNSNNTNRSDSSSSDSSSSDSSSSSSDDDDDSIIEEKKKVIEKKVNNKQKHVKKQESSDDDSNIHTNHQKDKNNKSNSLNESNNIEFLLRQQQQFFQQQLEQQKEAFQLQIQQQLQQQQQQQQLLQLQQQQQQSQSQSQVQPKSEKKERERNKKRLSRENEEDDGKFLFDVVNSALNNQTPNPKSTKIQKTTSFESSTLPVVPMNSFNLPSTTLNSVSMGLPSVPPGLGLTIPTTTSSTTTTFHTNSTIQNPFVSNDKVIDVLKTSGTDFAIFGTKKNKNKEMKTTPVASSSSSSSSSVTTATSSIQNISSDLNDSLNDGQLLNWDLLVEQTVQHPRYEKEYSFKEDGSWVKSRPYGTWCNGKILPAILAIDCEMCQVVDPVTDAVDTNALIRCSIINGLNPSEVLLDTLVLPAGNVTDIRSKIHGITIDMLAGVTTTLRHVQAFLMGICTDRTIIIGHSVHSDLKALHFNHRHVIDTSYLYTIENEPSAAASLRDISEHILKIKLPELHDSVQDARASLMAAIFVLKNGVPPSLTRSSKSDNTSLLIHRIPDKITVEHLYKMILDHTKVVPINILPIAIANNSNNTPTKSNSNSNSNSNDNNNATGKTTVTFVSDKHALLAFDTIAGPNKPDKSHKDQKRIYLSGGGYVCVRKC